MPTEHRAAGKRGRLGAGLSFVFQATIAIWRMVGSYAAD